MKFGRRAESPIDDQLAEADIQDRLALANTLRQRSMEGAQLDNVGGHLIGSPWARALTGVAQGIQGAGERKKAEGMATDLATSKRERLAQALGGAGQEPTPEARLKRGMELMGHPDPQAQAVGQYMAESAQKEIQQAAEAQQKQYGETNKDLRHMQDLYQRDQEGARRDAAAREAAESRNAATLEAARIRASGGDAGGGGGLTAHLKDIAYLRTLDIKPDDPPDVAQRKKALQDEYYNVARAQQVVDLGGRQAVLQPGAAPGTVATSLEKTVPPAQTAQHLAEVEREKKRVTLAPKAQAALSQFEAKTQQFNDAIDRAIKKTTGWSAGAMGWSSGIPLTPAKELAAELREIAANIGFDALQEMRANSPTGGALGNVANYEIENLQSTLGTLDQAREPEKIIETLGRIKTLRQASLQRMKDAYDETWGEAPMAPPPADDEDALIGKYLNGQP